MTTREMIAVMQAYEEGKKIQIANKIANNNENEWEDYDTGEPVWDWLFGCLRPNRVGVSESSTQGIFGLMQRKTDR